MKKLLKLTLGICMAACAVAMWSCGKDGDEPVNPDNPGIVDPSKPVNDPEGTVKLSMRSSGNGDTRLDNSIYINSGDNFSGAYFHGFGMVSGLGNVVAIPKKNYVDTYAVTPGEGYVAYSNGKFYRIYVADFITNTIGGIIGADIRYQAPFYGVDEELKTKNTVLSFDSFGGSSAIIFENQSIIPFDISCDKTWCHVMHASTQEYPFLTDAINIVVDPTEQTDNESAIVAVTTKYGKDLKIQVNRLGASPFLSFEGDEVIVLEKDYAEQTFSIGIVTNLDIDDISVEYDGDYVSAEIINDSNLSLEAKRMLRWIGELPAYTSRGETENTKTYRLQVHLAENADKDGRNTKFIIKSDKYNLKSECHIMQTAANISIKGITGNAMNITNVAATYSLPILDSPEMEVVTAPDWISAVVDNGNILNLNITSNPIFESRKGVVALKATAGDLSYDLTIVQEKASITIDGSEDPATIYLDKNTHSLNFIVESSVPFEVTSSVAWCTAHLSGKNLSITTSSSDEIRSTHIIFDGTPLKLEIKQTRWAEGDLYNDGLYEGTIVNLGENTLICKQIGTAKWSEQNITTGAVSATDGMYNTDLVHSIANWQTLYPAFKLVEDLNVGGATGWYLPAIEEMSGMSIARTSYSEYHKSCFFLSSTEDSQSACACYLDGVYNWSIGLGSGWYKYSCDKDKFTGSYGSVNDYGKRHSFTTYVMAAKKIVIF